MTDAREALRERVADAIAKAWDEEGRVIDAADAAIAMCMEEAARVAEGVRTEAAGNEYQSGKPGDFWDRDSIYGCGREDAAAAIRAMMGTD